MNNTSIYMYDNKSSLPVTEYKKLCKLLFKLHAAGIKRISSCVASFIIVLLFTEAGNKS